MSKTDKELAVDLTVATLEMITHHKLQNGHPSLNTIDQEQTIDVFKRFYKAIKEADNQFDNP